jgi:TolB-like protein
VAAPRLEIALFGACAARLSTEGRTMVDIRGAKHRALFALLATAPMGRRSRAYLQRTLWGDADYDSGHQNLRRALADLRKLLGPDFETVLHATATDLQLSLDHTCFVPGTGAFLHDLEVREPAFLCWRDEMRARPAELAAFGRAGHTGALRLRPRISALPLTVPGGDPAMRVLGDWAAEEICRGLSRSTLLTVISHLSGRAMAGRMIDIATVRETLGVDYLVTGTLRAFGSEIVCDFDFVDVASGTILWNRNLVCPADAILHELPDRLSDVLQAVGRSVAESTLRNLRGLALPEIADHELLIAGVSCMHRPAIRDFVMARHYLGEAASRAPRSADVQAWLGKWHVLNVFKGYSTDRAGDTQRALDCTARALDLDPDSSFALTIDGFAMGNILGDMGQAGRRYAAALDRNPNESLGWLLRGALLAFQDQGAAAVHATETARRLSPIDPFGYYYDSLAATAHIAAGNFGQALSFAERSLAVNDRHISTLRVKVTAQHGLGDGAGARATAADLCRRFPEFRLDDYRRTHPSADRKVRRLVIEALSAAGIS